MDDPDSDSSLGSGCIESGGFVDVAEMGGMYVDEGGGFGRGWILACSMIATCRSTACQKSLLADKLDRGWLGGIANETDFH